MHFVVILVLNKYVLARLEYFVSEDEDQFFVGFDAKVAEVVDV